MSDFKHSYALVANGHIHEHLQIAKLIADYACVVAVDGGVNHCHKMGVTPDMIIGDFDSSSPEVLKDYENVVKRTFPCDKNETDLELALQSIYTPQVEKITLFGALENRTDHALSNLHLIRRYPGKVFIETEKELIFSITGEHKISCQKGQTISFIHLGRPPSGINSHGLRWELRDATFSKYFFSISNICLTNPVKISIADGDLLCILQKA
jgi:thiamine pyrophosphokinase